MAKLPTVEELIEAWAQKPAPEPFIFISYQTYEAWKKIFEEADNE